MASGPEASRDSWEATDALAVEQLSLQDIAGEPAVAVSAAEVPSE